MATTQARAGAPAPSSPSPSKHSSGTSQDSVRVHDHDDGITRTSPQAATTNGSVPRPKRIACVVCRKRKLRCDGTKPSCGTCSRLGHNCAYDEIRRKSGPKRGYVKALEARLAQVETLLNQTSAPELPSPPRIRQPPYGSQLLVDPPLFGDSDVGMDGMDAILGGMGSHDPSVSPNIQSHNSFESSPMIDIAPWNSPLPGAPAMDPPPAMVWDLISMGFEEALPAQDVIDALHTIYFEKIHPCMPVLHRGRYLASLNMAPSLRPPVALRYAIWTMAASVSDEHSGLQTHFYRRARKYLEDMEMKGHGEGIITVATPQAWLLVTTYEFKLMYFPRAWMSTGRAVRLAQMMGLHRLDGAGLEVKQCLPAPKDWIEREERRRTFWAVFCLDRYASIGTGWPMSIEEKDILTNLPVSEESFERGQPSKSMTLKDAMTANGAAMLSPYGGVCLMACLFGRNLIHLHRPDADDKDSDLNGEFWRRHRNMDNILLNIQMSLPNHFRLPAGIDDANVVFTNMNIHTSTICLHQAAIFKAEKNRMSSTVTAESKIRCITAAAQIASIMRMVCHLDLSGMNPFISFCLYVAARVFVQYLKSRPGDEQVHASLQFLLTAMGHMKKKNPLTESFLVQLDVDITGNLETGGVNKFPYTFRRGQEEAPPERTRDDMYPTPHPVQDIPVEELGFNRGCGAFPMMMEGGGGGRVRTRERSESATLSPQMSNHSGQSPASIDLSDASQNSSSTTSSSQSNNTQSYSPPGYFSEFSGLQMGGIGGGACGPFPHLSKEMDWSMLASFDSPGMNGNLGHLSGMPDINILHTEMNGFFGEPE